MSDSINAIAIIIIILILVGLLSITINISKIKTNWKEYQCNPIFIPFSSIFSSKSASETFNVCISNYVKNFMNIFIEPFLNMFDVFINYAEIMFKFLDSFKGLANIFHANIEDFIKHFKEILNTIVSIIENVIAGISEALNQIQTILSTIQNTYVAMLEGAGSLLGEGYLGALVSQLETLDN